MPSSERWALGLLFVAVVEHPCSDALSSAFRPAETDRRHQHPAQTTRAQRFATHRLKLLTELSTVLARLVRLPDLVDQLTPKGRLPTEGEAARMV